MTITIDALRKTVDEMGSIRAAERFYRAKGVEISERTIRRRLKDAVAATIDEDEDEKIEEINFDELFEARKRIYEMKKASTEAKRVVNRSLKLDGPFAIGFPADTHLDSDGADVGLAFEHAELFNGQHVGMYAIHLGDVWNNWSGRLSRLWADQSTNAKQAQMLVTEYLSRVQWLAFQTGNHDAWSPAQSNIIDYVLKTAGVPTAKNQMRLELMTPSGRPLRIMTRHGFPRSSMWNTAHGVSQRAQLDGWANIYIGGHTHVSGYQHGWHDGFQQMWHAVQVASYKKVDDFAEELGLLPCDLYCCPVAIVNPYATNEINFIRWEFDPFEATERLKWERKRWVN